MRTDAFTLGWHAGGFAACGGAHHGERDARQAPPGRLQLQRTHAPGARATAPGHRRPAVPLLRTSRCSPRFRSAGTTICSFERVYNAVEQLCALRICSPGNRLSPAVSKPAQRVLEDLHGTAEVCSLALCSSRTTQHCTTMYNHLLDPGAGCAF